MGLGSVVSILFTPIVLILIVLDLVWYRKRKRAPVQYIPVLLLVGYVVTAVTSFIPSGTEETITGFACDGACYEMMTKGGFPLTVYHPNGANSVSWFFDELAFVLNYLIYTSGLFAIVFLSRFVIRSNR